MLTYLRPEDLTAEQMAGLEESGRVGGWTAFDVGAHILSGRWKVFAVPTGVLAVSLQVQEDGRSKLLVEALAIKGFGWMMRHFRDAMDRLATDWGCHTVETICFDERLAEAMIRIRAKPVGWVMQWQVEGMSNGH